MTFKSDVTYDTTPFSQDIPPPTLQLNSLLVQKGSEDPKWWEIGAVEYRNLRAAGKSSFPAPVLLPHATEIQVPASDDPSRTIPCRVFKPSNGAKSKGIFYHIHGGGWVLGGANGQDLLLDHIAKNTDLTVISVEYRLAPEHVFPAAVNDCNDVGVWLSTAGKAEFGDLKFLGGESAGGNLTAAVLLHLRSKNLLTTVLGSVLNYGCYDLSLLPSSLSAGPETPILPTENILVFTNSYLTNISIEDRKKGYVSPMYNDLQGLGSALFLLGTQDALIDDSVLMHSRWIRAGNEGFLRFVSGAPHGFMTFDGNSLECTRDGWKIMIEYLKEKL